MGLRGVLPTPEKSGSSTPVQFSQDVASGDCNVGYNEDDDKASVHTVEYNYDEKEGRRLISLSTVISLIGKDIDRPNEYTSSSS